MSRPIDYIRSLEGVKITFLDIKPHMIRAGHAMMHLAKTCRYHGLLDGWYSNAEHSVLCSYMSDDPFVQKACLIHDFGEYITADVAGPVKRMCPDYDTLCERVQTTINLHFLGVGVLPSDVKRIDKMMCATEQKYLRQAPQEDLEAEPFQRVWHPKERDLNSVYFYEYEWRGAVDQLRSRFNVLFPDYKDVLA